MLKAFHVAMKKHISPDNWIGTGSLQQHTDCGRQRSQLI